MIKHVAHEKVLITPSLEEQLHRDYPHLDLPLKSLMRQIYDVDASYFREKIVYFYLTGQEAKDYLPILLKDYASGLRGKLEQDKKRSSVYWFKVWINGNILLRLLDLSDYITFEVDLDKIVEVTGNVDDFEVVWDNQSRMKIASNMKVTF